MSTGSGFEPECSGPTDDERTDSASKDALASTSKSEMHEGQSRVLPSGVKVTYRGHREVPESEQTWEIHIQPKGDKS